MPEIFCSTKERGIQIQRRVFRNEDAGWGWPPYLKFNSAVFTAESQEFATDQTKPWVLVK